MIWRTVDVPHQLGQRPDAAASNLHKTLCSKVEKVYQHPFQILFLQTFPRNNPHIRHAFTEVRRNGHRSPMLHQCHHRVHQARLLLHENYMKQRGSPSAGTKNKRTQDLYPLILVENFHRVRLAYGDGHSPRRRDQELATRAQKAERLGRHCNS